MKNAKKGKLAKPKPRVAPNFDIDIRHTLGGAVGHDLTITVEAVADELISRVETTLDSMSIGDDTLSPPNSLYKREFFGQGYYTPGNTHRVVVKVTGTTSTETATSIWNDI